jgi:hypothetical protein
MTTVVRETGVAAAGEGRGGGGLLRFAVTSGSDA